MKKKEKEKMWYKIDELKTKFYNNSQISRELKVDRGTVEKYIKLSKEEFDRKVKRESKREKKLDKYYEQIETMLKECSELSASQIADRLEEMNRDYEKVGARTVFNYVQYVRKEAGISKAKGTNRDYEKVTETPYGLQAQCDFGSIWMQREEGGKIKIYFMALVLSRSRAKYIYYQSKPFTTVDAIKAHNKGFEYYGGCPNEIWYDQDRVFAIDENLGDFKFTEEFRKYIKSEVFEAKFCKKADPQSKGKVENVVKFVKGNFLKGRKFKTIDLLQEQGDRWLARTGNGKEHEGIKLIPIEELEKERPYLKIPNNSYEMPKVDGTSYNLRKDNTVCYRSNYYTVPTGTYQGNKSTVALKEENGVLQIFDKTRCLITTHLVSTQKGKTISKSDHRRDKSTSLNEKIEIVINKLNNDTKCVEYLNELRKRKPRNIHDELNNMLRLSKQYSDRELKEAIHEAMILEIYNSNDIRSVIIKRKAQQIDYKNDQTQSIEKKEKKDKILQHKYTDMQPIRSEMIDFEKIFN